MSGKDVRVDFFKIIATDGDQGLFGDKLKSICNELPDAVREIPYGTTHVNLTLLEVPEGTDLIVGRFFQSRNDNISKRKRGTVATSPIPLDEDEDVDETAYFAYCPSTSLIGVGHNFHGPKIRLMVYVVNKIYKEIFDKQEKRNDFQFISRGEAVRRVMEKRTVRGVTARLKDPSVDPAANLQADLPEVVNEFDAPTDATVELTVKSKHRGGIIYNIADFKRKFLKRESDVHLYDVFTVDVSDDQTGNMITYDLVKDRVQERIKVNLQADGRTIMEDDMIRKLTTVTNSVKSRYTY